MTENMEQRGLPETGAPAGATQFKFPAGMAAFMLFSSVLSFSLMICLPFALLSRPKPGALEIAVIGALLAGAGSFYTFQTWQRFRDTIAVNADGIWYLSRNGQSTYIAWNDLARIDALETQQRLVLSDRSGTRKIRLEYQLTDFSKLRNFVLSHAVALAKTEGPASGIFHRSWINKSILLGSAGLFLFFAYGAIQQPPACMTFIAFGVAMLAGITRDPTTLQITSRAVVIAYPGWKQTIDLHTITEVSLSDIYDGKGNVWAAVVINRTAGKPIKLFRFREGSIALCAALQSAWRAEGGTEVTSIQRGSAYSN